MDSMIFMKALKKIYKFASQGAAQVNLIFNQYPSWRENDGFVECVDQHGILGKDF